MAEVSPKKWIERYERSKKAQKAFKDDFIQFRKSYMGDNYNKRKGKPDFRDEMHVNYIYQMVETIGPTVFAGNPNIITMGKRPDLEQSAENQQANINYWLKELDADYEFSCALFDSFFGPAAIEVGWEYVTQVEQQPDPDDPSGGMVTLPNGMPGMDPSALAPNEVVLEDRPFLRWRNFWDIFLDIDVPRRKDGRFIIVRDILTYDQFMGIQEIPLELREKVKPTLRPNEADDEDMTAKTAEEDLRSDKEWVEMLTIWDKENMMKRLLCPQVKDEFMYVGDWPYEMKFRNDPFPITILDGKTDFQTPYTFSEIRPIWDHIQERDRLRTASLIHIKRAIPKYMYSKGAGTRAQVSKLMNSRTDEATELNDPNQIMLAPVTQNPPEYQAWDMTMKNDIDNVSSMAEFQNQSLADTATEASIIEGRGVVRKKARSQKFEQFVVTCAGKLAQICQQFQDKAIATKIANGNGDTRWLHISKDDIQGDFDYVIEPGTMEYKNDALQKQQTLKFAELMSQNPSVNQQWLARQLCKVFDKDPTEALLTPQQMQANQPPPEPTLRFKSIDLREVASPAAQAEIVDTAMTQNGMKPPPQNPMINPGSAPPMPPMPGGSSGINHGVANGLINDLGGPKGGKVPLGPNAGQAEIQPASEVGGML